VIRGRERRQGHQGLKDSSTQGEQISSKQGHFRQKVTSWNQESRIKNQESRIKNHRGEFRAVTREVKSIASFVLYLHSVFIQILMSSTRSQSLSFILPSTVSDSATSSVYVSIEVSLIIILVGPGRRERALRQSIFR
jgi:hypothetical protein